MSTGNYSPFLSYLFEMEWKTFQMSLIYVKNEPVCETHFRMNGFARKRLLRWLITVLMEYNSRTSITLLKNNPRYFSFLYLLFSSELNVNK